MSKIRLLTEDLDERVRSLMPKEKAVSYIDDNDNGIYSTNVSIVEKTKPIVYSSKKLYGNRLSESTSLSAKRNKEYNSLIEKATDSPISVISNAKYVSSPYSYKRIDEFFRKESYFSRSVFRKIETMMRNGYEINSDDPKALKIVKKELARIELTSKVGFDQFIFQVAQNILKYGICIVKKLKDTNGNITRLVCINPQNVVFKFNNETGELISITDRTPSRFGKAISKVFKNISPNTSSTKNTNPNETDISEIGLCVLYDAGEYMFPEPPCFQLLDDILTLRSLEETVELLAFQFGSPLLHVSVGSSDNPATPEDVRRVHNEVVAMASNGMLTTDFTTKIEVKNLQSGIADLMPYIEHFKKRVLAGAGSSSVSIGESDTGTRSSTESIDNALADQCAYVSSIIASMVNNSIIPDILTKKGYKLENIFDDSGELLVKMEFLDVDVSKMISRENHILSMYQGNAITQKEMRKLTMRPPISDQDEEDTYLYHVQIPLRLVGGEDAADSSAASTKSKDQPSNQYGSKNSPGSNKK